MSYANYDTPHVCSENAGVSLKMLQEMRKRLFEWLLKDFLKTNAINIFISF